MSNIIPEASLPLGVAVGTAVGGAVSGGITPVVQELINEANAAFPLKPPSYFFLAEGVAKGKVDAQWARDRAAEQGIGNGAFNRLTVIAAEGPGTAAAFELWRRDIIDDAAFGRALKHGAIDEEWIGPLRQLKERLLSPAELAAARQQEFIDDTRLHSEGGLQGYDAERMDLMFKMAGLPPGAMEGLELLRRGIIDETTYRAIVAEGHTKTKYTDALLALEQHILSATDAANLWLRGWLTEPEAKAIGQQNGYDGPAMDLLYKNRGRPATVRQAHIGFARGGRLPGVTTERETILRAVQESDIRTEWFDIEYAQRYTYPSAFVIRALAQDGTFTPQQTEDILLESGWRPDLAQLASEKWGAATTGAATQKWADRARGRLFTVAHDEYRRGKIDEPELRAALGQIPVAGAEQNAVVTLFTADRDLFTRDLTKADVKRLYGKNIWDVTKATTYLEDMGYEAQDVADFLSS